MNNDMKLYYDYTISPLGKLFYKSLFSQLGNIKNQKVLDFGSGFGFTTSYLAKKNEVTALEIDENMIEFSDTTNPYKQLHGDLEIIKAMEDESFDFITCHLVLEFVDNPQEILDELMRVLKKDGQLSIVRHNKNGRIIQAIVQDYDLNDANHLLNGGFSFSSAFGNIKYYSNEYLNTIISHKLQLQSIQGLRVLASSQNQMIQNQENWVDEMFSIESKLFNQSEFIPIAYFNHLIYTKK